MENLNKYRDDLANLTNLGAEMFKELASRLERNNGSGPQGRKDAQASEQQAESVETHYQGWYTESHALIKQLLPDRVNEFKELYMGSGRVKTIDGTNFNIQNWLMGMRAPARSIASGALSARPDRRAYQDVEIVAMRVKSQLDILIAVRRRFESSLFDIRQMVQADIFDSELESAAGLAKNGFTRAAGSLAGVVLERHLGQVATNHSISIRKRNPTISDFNDALKDNESLDTPTWRQIQRLGDIRNLCSHNKEREPTREEVDELIGGVGKFTKTLF